MIESADMNTKLVVSVIGALLIGLGGGYVLADNKGVPENQHLMPDGTSMHGQMNDMMAGLSGKTGDEFDKAFIAEMIVHHEGAVDMAEAALLNARHEEIKQMANAIISAQTTEREQMKEWQKLWYGE